MFLLIINHGGENKPHKDTTGFYFYFWIKSPPVIMMGHLIKADWLSKRLSRRLYLKSRNILLFTSFSKNTQKGFRPMILKERKKVEWIKWFHYGNRTGVFFSLCFCFYFLFRSTANVLFQVSVNITSNSISLYYFKHLVVYFYGVQNIARRLMRCQNYILLRKYINN